MHTILTLKKSLWQITWCTKDSIWWWEAVCSPLKSDHLVYRCTRLVLVSCRQDAELLVEINIFIGSELDSFAGTCFFWLPCKHVIVLR
jgi:hypothetical protein